MATYDDDNVFARILRNEIPCDRILETEHALAFNDIAPQAPVHVLVIPKGKYVSMVDFATAATAEEQAGLFAALAAVVTKLELAEGGYRLIANNGRAANQEVPHVHWHVLAGEDLGPMRAKPSS